MRPDYPINMLEALAMSEAYKDNYCFGVHRDLTNQYDNNPA